MDLCVRHREREREEITMVEDLDVCIVGVVDRVL